VLLVVVVVEVDMGPVEEVVGGLVSFLLFLFFFQGYTLSGE
jgi:hypothetical protein